MPKGKKKEETPKAAKPVAEKSSSSVRPGKDMPVDSFVKELHMEVEKFSAKWHEGMKKEKEKWPKAMPEGDWFDQFLCHLGSKADKVAGYEE